MRSRTACAAMLLVVLPLAGCLSTQAPADLPSDLAVGTVTEDLVDGLLTLKHDHKNASQHAVARGLKPVAHAPLVEDDMVGECGYQEITVQDDYAYQVLGCGSRSGFAIVDISDPASPERVSTYWTATPFVWDVKVSDDAEVAFVGIQGTPGLSYDPTVAPDRGGTPTSGVQAVDISDKEDPTFLASFPIYSGGHNLFHHRMDGRDVVMVTVNHFVTSAAGVAPLPVHVEDPVQTRIQLLEFHRDGTTGPGFEALSSYRYVPDEPVRTKEGAWYQTAHFPHDVFAQEHPTSDRDLMYVAYWDAGMRIVDISDPSDPTEVGAFEGFDKERSGNVHYVQPFPELIDGKHYTLASPEFVPHDDSGLVRILDTTDPEDPTVVGTWTYPKDVISGTDNGAFATFSAHNADIADGRIYQSAYHAGVWVLDVAHEGTPEDPKAVGVLAPTPSPKLAERFDTRSPNVWGTAVAGDHVLMGDIGTGLHVADTTGW